jgi:hypothetical protein
VVRGAHDPADDLDLAVAKDLEGPAGIDHGTSLATRLS